LEECIRSVLAQDFTDWEYILVNNRSTDDTLAIAESFARQDRRIRIVCNDSFVPVGENHNIAFRTISPSSVYCKVVSADDTIAPTCLRKMIELARSHPSVGIIGSYQLSAGNVKWKGLSPAVSVLPGRDVCRMDLLDGIHVFGNPTSVLYRSDLIRMTKAFFPHGQPHADTSACYRSLQNCDFGFVHEVLSEERIHPGQISVRIDKLGAGDVAYLEILLKYGPVYLVEEELAQKRVEVLEKYHRVLGGCCLKLKGREFWRYQSTRMRELGIPINWSKVAAGAIAEALTECKHPRVALGKIKLALKQVFQ
jgi:glycosyltransferase involved in cell wall biosynthesis